MADLSILPRHPVTYGGFRSIDLKPRETVIAAPATGAYSGAAVEVASTVGARVSIIQLNGNVEEDLASLMKFGPADTYPLPLLRNRLTSEAA